ncbi:acetyl-CoA synthetase-like protein [Martensiomyces pterosporus]|nr:acetyl-CoA synthetase-like protein [Martensiomyces pterosporus]
MSALYSIHVPGTGSKDETPVHRYPAALDSLTACAPPNITTIYQAFQHRLSLNPDKLTLGQRPVLEIINKDKITTRQVGGKEQETRKRWSYFRLGGYEWMTYREIAKITRNVGAGLVQLGLGADSRVVIYAPTSREWTLCALSCYSQSMQVVTAYDTLGEEGLVHAMNQSKAAAIFLKADQLPMLERIASKVETVRYVVYYQDQYGMPQAAAEALEKVKDKFEVLTMDGVQKLGAEHPADLKVATREDIALVMYTSGTTGPPKGVLIAHEGLLSICGAIHQLVPDYIDYEEDRVLSYLPLSHVLAFFVETYCIYSGLAVGYGSPRTLTEDNVSGCLGDIRTLKPAVMLGVPQVWNTIRASILRQVMAKPWLVQQIFFGAVELKTWLTYYGLPTGVLDQVVFRKTREGTGGKLKIVITGGAPINEHVQKLIAAAVCPMIQGYGMTEMSGLVSVQIPGDLSLGNIGPPVPSVECKLVDVPEAGYFASNNEGEIWLRGPSVFRGYLDNEEETRNTVSVDGWVKTGDIARWTKAGQLSIIDRKKNLIKLAQGEYIALERLESAYSTSKYVNNICVCADSRMTQPVALVNIDANAIGGMADRAGIAYTRVDELAEDRRFLALVLEDLLMAAKHSSLVRQEILADVRVDPELWTPENGMLTAASKLKRNEIQEHNKRKLDDMLSRLL